MHILLYAIIHIILIIPNFIYIFQVLKKDLEQSIPTPALGEYLIKPLLFEGRAVSCLIKPSIDEAFALIEAVAKLYFPAATITDLQLVLIEQLQIPLYTLSKKEEMAFINFYGLPTNHLKCNRAISLNYLQKCVNKLRVIFSSKVAIKSLPLSHQHQQNRSRTSPHESRNESSKRKNSIRNKKLAVESIKAKLMLMKRKRTAEESVGLEDLTSPSSLPTPVNITSHTVVSGSAPPSLPVFPNNGPVFPVAELSPASSEQSFSSMDSLMSPPSSTSSQPPKQKRRLEDTVSLLRSRAQAKH